MEEGGRRSRRAAAPVFDTGASTSTRASRSSISNNVAQETKASPARPSRSTRSGRGSTRIAVSSSPALMDVENEEEKDVDGGDEEDAMKEDEFEAGDDDDDDDDDDDEEGGEGEMENSRRRVSTARHRGSAPKRAESIILNRSSRQRSAVQQSQTPPPRASRVRGRKVDEEEPTTEQEEEEEEDGEVENVRRPSSRRRKSHASPLKGSVKTQEEEEDVEEDAAVESSNISFESFKPGADGEEVDGGWIEDMTDKKEAHDVYLAIVDRIKGWLNERGNATLTNVMSKEQTRKDDRYLTAFIRPVTLQNITQKIQHLAYTSSVDFEKDMLQLFRSCRRYFDIGTDEYGGTVALQRMYHHITQSVDAVREPIEEELQKRNCASIRYGPCQEPEGQGYGESPCTGEMAIVPRHFYKGKALSVGMWVHLSNPTDPARPIVAQIFKTRVDDLEDRRQDWITACWFLRPEQSRHLRTMTFWEDEVIKTSQLVEHHVEDVLEVVCVNFYTKAARGTPAEGEGGWHVGDPLYICENRYQADKDAYFKIKNWASCLPEETRYKKFHMVEYDQPINLPDKLSSPFLRGIDGPGEIVKELRPSGSGVVASRGLRDGGLDERTIGQPGVEFEVPELFKEWRDEMAKQRRAALRVRAEQRLAREKREQGTTTYVGGTSHSALSNDAEKAVEQGEAEVKASKEKRPPIAEAQDRSLINALSQVDVSAYFQTLPESTRQLFLQDAETGKVLWYPAPPIVVDERAALQRRWNDGETFRGHSAEYLLFRDKTSQESKGKRKSPSTAQDEMSLEHSIAAKRQAKENHFATMSSSTEYHPDATNSNLDLEKAFSEAIRGAGGNLSRFITVDNDFES